MCACSEQAKFEATGRKLNGCSGGSLGWSRSCDQLLDHHVFGPKPSSETRVRSGEVHLPECPRGSMPLRGRFRCCPYVRRRRSLAVANGDISKLSPRGASVNDPLLVQCCGLSSRALFFPRCGSRMLRGSCGNRRGTRLLWINRNHEIQTGDSGRPLHFAYRQVFCARPTGA